MNWRKRIRDWLAALAIARKTAGRIPWLTLLLALLSGPVPRSVWHQRMRRCETCPIFTKQGHRCRGAIPQLEQFGCDCYVPFSAMTAEPYPGGCWGRATFGGDFGWGAYSFPSRWAKALAFIRFLFRR